MKEFSLYRRRIIPNECILLKDDEIVFFDNDKLVTRWNTMLLLYGAFVAGLAKEEKNLAYLTMEHTVHMYGYADIETAEQKMW